MRKQEIEQFINQFINPSLSSHGGWIHLHKFDEETCDIQIEFGGGCQGCAGARMTMKAGVETALKENFPYINNIEDITNHDEGSNPFY